LANEALAQLVSGETPEGDLDTQAKDKAEEKLEQPIRLHDQRLDRVAAILAQQHCRRVIDLGCGEGKLIKRLLADVSIDEVLGVDISTRTLEIAAQRLGLERMHERQRRRVRLVQGALTYRDKRLEGYDAAALIEVIEHLDAPRLAALERVLFGFAKPDVIVITTPNREYNVKFEGLAEGKFRHADHRFEWTRLEFEAWGQTQAGRYGYKVSFEPVGDLDEALGAPSQLAVFTR
jgi:3' terminal RNA ribose 2'-O-methyltransferase Hen1